MRFRRLAVSLLALAGLVPSCDTRERRVEDICKTLRECSGYLDVEGCGRVIEDELLDKRMTAGEMVRCAHCLGDHDRNSAESDPEDPADDPEDCHDLLVERDCDESCAAVTLALRVKTNSEMRSGTCRRFNASCGTVDGAAACAAAIESTLEALPLESQLQLDERMSACRDCIVAPAEQAEADSMVSTCSAMVTACREPCRQVGPINTQLELASDIVTVCRNDASCFPARGTEPCPTEGEGGAGGEAAVPMAMEEQGGQGGAPQNAGDVCMARLLERVGTLDGGAGAPATGGNEARGIGGEQVVDIIPGLLGEGGLNSQGVESPVELIDDKEFHGDLADCALCIGDLTSCPEIFETCACRCKDVRGK